MGGSSGRAPRFRTLGFRTMKETTTSFRGSNDFTTCRAATEHGDWTGRTDAETERARRTGEWWGGSDRSDWLVVHVLVKQKERGCIH